MKKIITICVLAVIGAVSLDTASAGLFNRTPAQPAANQSGAVNQPQTSLMQKFTNKILNEEQQVKLELSKLDSAINDAKKEQLKAEQYAKLIPELQGKIAQLNASREVVANKLIEVQNAKIANEQKVAADRMVAQQEKLKLQQAAAQNKLEERQRALLASQQKLIRKG